MVNRGWSSKTPAWDGVSDVGRANKEHLGQVERHVLSHAVMRLIRRFTGGHGWKELKELLGR